MRALDLYIMRACVNCMNLLPICLDCLGLNVGVRVCVYISFSVCAVYTHGFCLRPLHLMFIAYIYVNDASPVSLYCPCAMCVCVCDYKLSMSVVYIYCIVLIKFAYCVLLCKCI